MNIRIKFANGKMKYAFPYKWPVFLALHYDTMALHPYEFQSLHHRELDKHL